MISTLIASIGRQLNIPGPHDDRRLCRIVYSAAGQMALASLWDHTEDENSVSLQHFKKRIAETFDAYESLCPGLAALLPRDRALIDEMYAIYLRSGHFYHATHQIAPAAPARAGYGNLALHQGASPDARLFMSGLGFYFLPAGKNPAGGSAASMFGLQAQTLESYLNDLLEPGEWEAVAWPEHTEFLRLDPSRPGGYWQQTPNQDGRISLARYGEPNKLFAFCRYRDGACQQKPIPQWRIQDTGGFGEHRRISAALLKRYGTLPEIKAAAGGGLVEIELGYRLPPSEEVFFKLYSWPARYDAPHVFARTMAEQVYPVFRRELEAIGYRFLEG